MYFEALYRLPYKTFECPWKVEIAARRQYEGKSITQRCLTLRGCKNWKKQVRRLTLTHKTGFFFLFSIWSYKWESHFHLPLLTRYNWIAQPQAPPPFITPPHNICSLSWRQEESWVTLIGATQHERKGFTRACQVSNRLVFVCMAENILSMDASNRT